MTTARPITIGIIGGGFSGTLLAVHLLRRCRRGDTVVLFERNQSFGRGQAYATGNPDHLLNVRAGNMSAFPDEPGHFVEWLKAKGEVPGSERGASDSFVSRQTYGTYVQSLLGSLFWESETGSNVAFVRDEVVALDELADRVEVTVASGQTYRLDRAVLATGNLPPDADVGAYRGNPWAADACAGIPSDAPVLLIGSGLTTVDVVLSLLKAGHAGPIWAISRRGLVPHAHEPSAVLAFTPRDLPRAGSLASLTRWLRRTVREAAARGIGWHGVIDGLRPHLASLWQAMPLAERRRFLRHLRPYWDIHRHRLAPEVAATLRGAIASGQLRIVAGRILDMEASEDRATATIRRRGAAAGETLEIARAINCSGPATNYEACSDPLLRHLLDSGAARPDALQLGLDVTLDAQLVDIDGRVSERLLAVGPLTRGVFWETVAVSEIRQSCARLARHILESVATPQPAPAVPVELDQGWSEAPAADLSPAGPLRQHAAVQVGG